MRRTNLKSALAVERAIRVADKGKTEKAATICVSNNVPIDVALRVITKPKQRRTYNLLKNKN